MKMRTIEIGVGFFVLLGLLAMAYLTIKLGKMEMFGGDYYYLEARFGTVSGLKTGAQVEIAGVQVGQVESIEIDIETMRAVVIMKIQREIPIDTLATASIKTSGLIGDKYLHIDPGGELALLEDGGVIEYTNDSVDLEALIGRVAFGSVADE